MVLDVYTTEIGINNLEMILSDYSLTSPEDLYREIYTNMSQFREPPPYPGLPKQSSSQTGLHQSFSGSEASTDVSVSSNENLASGQRQEPQGEETQVSSPHLVYDASGFSDYSIMARLGMPASEIDQKLMQSSNTPHIYVTPGNGVYSSVHGPYIATSVNSPAHGLCHVTHSQTQNLYHSSESGFSGSESSKHQLGGESDSSTNISRQSSGFSCDTSLSSNLTSPSGVTSYSSSTLYANYPQQWTHSAMDYGSPQMSRPQAHLNFQKHHLNQQLQQQQLPSFMSHTSMHSGQPHMNLNHLNSSPLPPPPTYPGFQGHEAARRSYEILGKTEIPGSRSQPELSHLLDQRAQYPGVIHTPGGSGSDRGSQHSLEHCVGDGSRYADIDQIAFKATSMVNVLSEENHALRQKLSVFERKVMLLQKFEMELQNVHEGYESLQKSSKKIIQKESAMKKHLEEELKKQKAVNNSLIQQLQKAGLPVPDAAILASVEPSDSSMVHLLAKHKEVLGIKERQEMEIEAMKMTIQEQRAQIDILRNVQASQMRLDEEERRQQLLAEYDEEIKQELASIKAAYEKKEQTETNIRLKLEKELEYCRRHHVSAKSQVSSNAGACGKGKDGKAEMNVDIKKLLEEKEAKILQLEKELIQWKEQQLEESIRKLKLQESLETDSFSRLPAYDQSGSMCSSSMCSSTCSSLSTETLINEAKADKLRQMEEVYKANRKVAELEASVKSLQSQLSEKEAILRVYQRSPMTRSSSVHTIYCTPHHSPRPSLVATGSLSRQGSHDPSNFLEVCHKKTGSTSALEAYSKISQEDLLKKIEDLKSGSKSNSDSEENPDSVWQV
ncbi:uncharacterized protein LOC127868309 isoform X2 [Dreissena polymorpha]|uniref:Angiomotin C-terminal domain-containing protein n=1 Tax=Dreissena polymorpha TaxID=45954 RepID=A0A9D4M5E8_DREPO|nr:uncharacterized protein LOC127868279 isoform X2 [Dreissena polymorpha]XP_052265908.1 uncharacterized protein LOC127868309 isoform X2 [Dreissena polymorpha]KAH3870548.1 hypothetical protein DPMN_033737 [Dreissena polymorpha]